MCWGNNARGQLGTGTPASSVDPVPVGGLPSEIVEIAAAMKNTCALDVDGDVYCWGDNHFDQLGNDTVGDETPIDTLGDRSSLIPVKVTAVAGPLTSISVGYECACGTYEGGEFVCWGPPHAACVERARTWTVAKLFKCSRPVTTPTTSGCTQRGEAARTFAPLTTRAALGAEAETTSASLVTEPRCSARPRCAFRPSSR